MMKHNIIKYNLLLFSIIMFVSSAHAEKIEKMQVIGSHIKRTNQDASPTLIINREQIDLTGYNSLGDVLRDLPTASAGGTREASLNSIQSASGTTLRGMGTNEILVLLNGQRVSPIGGSTSVDLTNIPLSAIEKIEILKDGASAVYGSDAIGGVINIITKKDFVGFQLNVQTSLTQRKEKNSLKGIASFLDFNNWNDKKHSWDQKGDKISIDASYGNTKKDINYLFSGQLKLNTDMYLRDRDFGMPEPVAFSPAGSPGSWSDDGTNWHADPNCPKENIKNGICKFDYGSYMQFMPQIASGSLFTAADTNINDINVSTTALYSFINSAAVIAPPPQYLKTPNLQVDRNVKGKDFRIPLAIAQKWGLPAKGPIELKYRLVHEKNAGPRHTSTNANYYQLQTSVNIPLLDTIEFDGHINSSHAYYLATGTSGWANIEKLTELANKTPSQFNPFLPQDKKSDVKYAIYKPVTKIYADLITITPQFTGEIFNTSHHTLSFAAGNLSAWQRYLQKDDEITAQGKQWGGGGSTNGESSRWYTSFYSELSLLSFDKIDLQLAARTDYYNDFGFTKQTVPFTSVSMPISPRVAVSVKPTEILQLRASWGLGFKVPSLANTNSTEIGHIFALDATICEKEDPKILGCVFTQHETTIMGNKKLTPELSNSFNIGIVIEPAKNIFFSADYYQTKQSNMIAAPSLRDVFKYEKKFTAAKLTDLKAKVFRDGNGLVKSVELSSINQATAKVQGVDLELGFSVPLAQAWNLNVKVDHSYMVYGEQKASEKSEASKPIPYQNEFIKELFECGIMSASKSLFSKSTSNKCEVSESEFYSTMYGVPRWRNNVTLNFINKDLGHNIQTVIQNIPPQRKDWKVKEQTDHYWQLDVAGTFNINKKTKLTVGIKNITGNTRPNNNLKYVSSGYITSSLYSIRGRTIDTKLTYNF